MSFNHTTRVSKVEGLIRESEDLERLGEVHQAIRKLEMAQKWMRASRDTARIREITLKINELSNLLAMNFLQKNEAMPCLEFLRKAERNFLDSVTHKSVTLNNLACYYRSQRQNRVALKFLLLAYEVLKHTKNRGLADLLLNICAVQSKLGRHNEAYLSAINAVSLLQNELLQMSLPFLNTAIRPSTAHKSAGSSDELHGNSRDSHLAEPTSVKTPGPQVPLGSSGTSGTTGARGSAGFVGQENRELSEREKEELNEKVNAIMIVYCIALHNQAVELEYLARFEESLEFYQKSHEMAESSFGPTSEICLNLSKVLQNARDKFAKKSERERQRLDRKSRGGVRVSGRPTPASPRRAPPEEPVESAGPFEGEDIWRDKTDRAREENLSTGRFSIEATCRFARPRLPVDEPFRTKQPPDAQAPASLASITSNSKLKPPKRRHTYNIKATNAKSALAAAPSFMPEFPKIPDLASAENDTILNESEQPEPSLIPDEPQTFITPAAKKSTFEHSIFNHNPLSLEPRLSNLRPSWGEDKSNRWEMFLAAQAHDDDPY